MGFFFAFFQREKSCKESQAAFLQGAICIQDMYKSLYIYLETKAIKTPQAPPISSETSLWRCLCHSGLLRLVYWKTGKLRFQPFDQQFPEVANDLQKSAQQ